MVIFKSGLSGGHCRFCKLKQSELVSHHGKKENSRIKCHAHLLTMEELILPYIYAQVNQQDEGGENNDGLRGPPHYYHKEVPLVWRLIGGALRGLKLR